MTKYLLPLLFLIFFMLDCSKEMICDNYAKDPSLVGTWYNNNYFTQDISVQDSLKYGLKSTMGKKYYTQEIYIFFRSDGSYQFDTVTKPPHLDSLVTKLDTIKNMVISQFIKIKIGFAKWFINDNKLNLCFLNSSTDECHECDCVKTDYFIHGDTLLIWFNDSLCKYVKK